MRYNTKIMFKIRRFVRPSVAVDALTDEYASKQNVCVYLEYIKTPADDAGARSLAFHAHAIYAPDRLQ